MSEDLAPDEGLVQLLPDALANQIAAGEVVERPASVIKELVENSLDAQATRILVDIEGAGKVLIRVVDDGAGMSPGDAERSLLRHATSKVRTSEDLDGISTLGFRGEALPSIASVSRFLLVTRQEHQDEATTLKVEGGAPPERGIAAAPVGTRIEVRDLFWNVPARLKFLKSDHTETQHVIDLMKGFALGHPHVHFRLGTGGRTPALDFTPVRRLYERVGQVLGRDTANALYEISYASSLIRISGFVSSPKAARSSPAGMTCFVNGRRVKDRVIHHAVVSAYGADLGPGRFPQAVVWLHIDPREVDVNVHPAKAEVRFRTPDQIHAAVSAAIQATLRARPWLENTPLEDYISRTPTQLPLGAPAEATDEDEDIPTPSPTVPLAPPTSAPEVHSPRARPSLRPLMPWEHPSTPPSASDTDVPAPQPDALAPSRPAPRPSSEAAPPAPLSPASEADTHHTQLAFGAKPKALFDEGLGVATPTEAPRKSQLNTPFAPKEGPARTPPAPRENLTPRPLPEPPPPPARPAAPVLPVPSTARVYSAPPSAPRTPPKVLGQSGQGLLIAEDTGGLYLIDVAAALAILTEQALQALAKPIAPQHLLLPGRLDMAAHEAKAVQARLSDLQALGVWIEPFGGGTFQLLGVPTALLRASPVRLLSGVSQLLARQPDADDTQLIRELTKAFVQSSDPFVLMNALYPHAQAFVQAALALPSERRDSRNHRAFTLLATSELERRLTS